MHYPTTCHLPPTTNYQPHSTHHPTTHHPPTTHQVHTELLTIACTAADLGTLRDYPDLKKAVMEVLTGVIQKQNDAAADLVKTIIAMETNRINIHHPDFLGDRSIIDVMKETEGAVMRREGGGGGGAGGGAAADGMAAPPLGGRGADSPDSMRVRNIGSSKVSGWGV